MLTILRDFRGLVAAVQALVLVLQKGVVLQEQLGPASERLDALELERHQFEAEIAGTLLKAEGKLKAANNAEARERALKRSYERVIDEGYPDGTPESEAEAVLPIDVEVSEEERVHELRLGMAPNNKAYALRAKWS